MKVFKRLTSKRTDKSLIDIMQNTTSSADDVTTAGLQLMTSIFHGKSGRKLNIMRHETYCSLVASSTRRPRPEKLPPTERAAIYHLFHCHLQMVRWKLLKNDSGLNAVD